MIRGIYSIASGMNVQIARIDAASNNLANISTPGFKKDRVITGPFPRLIQLSTGQSGAVPGNSRSEALGVTCQGAAVQQVVTDLSPGMLRETGNSTDLALKEPGFFTLADSLDEDTLYYTRNGKFKLDREGYLINDSGYRLMGEDGPVQITGDEQITVEGDGSIIADGQVMAKLSVASFNNPDALERRGSLYLPRGQEPEQLENPGIIQGFLEGSNVDPVEETVNMISAARAYETGQKIIQAQDSILGLAINKIGLLK